MKFVFDTETTGFVGPRLVQLAGILVDSDWREHSSFSFLVRPEGFEIPQDATAIHGITTEKATALGIPLLTALSVFNNIARTADELWAFNADYDKRVMLGEFGRIQRPCELDARPTLCAMLDCMNIIRLPGRFPGQYKWPKLGEAYRFFFSEDMIDAHDALGDVRATLRVMQATELHKQVAAETPIAVSASAATGAVESDSAAPVF